jgi:uncharacterized repeat protein (TIGR01451 family)
VPPELEILNLISSQGSCTNQGNLIQWDLGDISPGSEALITLTARPLAIGTITNNATVSAAQVDGEAFNNNFELELEVIPAVDLAMVVSDAPDPVINTQNILYSIDITNLGPSDATGVLFTHTISSETTLVDAIPSQGTCSISSNLVSCDLGSLPAGLGTAVSLEVTTLVSGLLTNLFTVQSGQADPDPGNNLAETVTTVQPAADLAVSIAGSAEAVVIDSPLTYLVDIVNLGPDTANNVTLINRLGPGLEFVSASSTQGSCFFNAGLLFCNVDSINIGANAQITLDVIPRISGLITNQVSVANDETDLVIANSTAAEATTVTVSSIPQINTNALFVTDAGPADLYPSTIQVSGQTAAVYRVTVALNGLAHDNPDDLDLLLVAPGGDSIMLMSDAGGSTAVTNINLLFSQSTTNLPADETLLLTGTYGPSNYGLTNDILALPAPEGPYTTNLLSLTDTDPNGIWSLYAFDDQSPASGGIVGGWQLNLFTLRPMADLRVTQTSTPMPVGVGSNLTFNVVITNQGPIHSQEVVLTNLLPADVSLISALPSQGACTNDNGVVSCQLGTVEANQQVTVTLVTTPSVSGVQTNQAFVQGYELDVRQNDNSSVLEITVEDPPVIIAAPTDLVVTNQGLASFAVSAQGTEPLSYQWLHEGLIIPDATNNTLALDPVILGDAGVYQVRIDNLVGSVTSDPAILTVLLPPSIAAVADQSTVEDTSTSPILLLVGDLETSADLLILSGEADNPGLIPPGNFNFGGSDSNRTVTIEPAENQFGSSLISITVQDTDGLATAVNFLLTVTPENDAPSIAPISNQVTTEDTTSAPVSISISDLESSPDLLTLSGTSSNPTLVPPANLSFDGIDGTRTLTLMPATNGFGTTTITVIASDPEGASSSQSFVLTVSPVNDAPTLDAIDDWTSDEDDGVQTIPLTGIGSGALNESQGLILSASSVPIRRQQQWCRHHHGRSGRRRRRQQPIYAIVRCHHYLH